MTRRSKRLSRDEYLAHFSSEAYRFAPPPESMAIKLKEEGQLEAAWNWMCSWRPQYRRIIEGERQ